MRGLRKLLPGKTNYALMKPTADDYEHIAHLHAESFPRGWTVAEIADLDQQPGFMCLIARKVGEPTGPLSGFNLVRQTSEEAEILSIAVAAKHRRNGLGDWLMREAIFRLQHDRVGSLVLEVDNANENAVRLYEKLGFVAVGNRPGYYQTGSQKVDQEGDKKNMSEPASALVMRLDLF